MDDVAHQVVQAFVVRKALVPAAHGTPEQGQPRAQFLCLHTDTSADLTTLGRPKDPHNKATKNSLGANKISGTAGHRVWDGAPVVANHEQRPEHGALRQPVERPQRPAQNVPPLSKAGQVPCKRM